MEQKCQASSDLRKSLNDEVTDGFDQLEQYLRSAPPDLEAPQLGQAAEPLDDEPDDPAQAGLDRLERTLRAVQRI